MASERDVWIEAVAKLIQSTQSGQLKWSTTGPVANAPVLIDSIGPAFYTTAAGKRLRLRKIRFDPALESTEIARSLGTIAFGSIGVNLKSGPSIRVVLEIVDPVGESVWTFPAVEPLKDLYNSVQYQVAGVKEFLEKLISEP